METLVITIPDKKGALVKQLLKELGVTIKSTKSNIPNALTIETIEKAHAGTGLGEPIKNIGTYLASI